MIIKSADDLKDPIVVFSAMRRYIEVSEEDFIDYNEEIVNGWAFAMWMLDNGYITSLQMEDIILRCDRYCPTLQETMLLLEGHITLKQIEDISLNSGNYYYPSLQDILLNDILFPNTYGHGVFSEIKAYTVLAEYLSSSKMFRELLYEAISDGSDKFEGGFYKDENGISLACIIDDDEMKDSFLQIKHRRVRNDLLGLTYKEQYMFVRDMSFEDVDKYL